jgi:phosphate-selective porin
MTLRQQISRLVALGGILVATASAQDSKALIDALIKKGILTNEEATQITTEVKSAQTAQDVATSGSKYLKKLTLSGRFQIQYAGLSTDIDGAAAQPPATNHLMVRRLYFGAKAEMGDGWSGNLNYDFGNLSFDQCFIEWKQSDALAIDAGLRKVPFGYEETTSSGSLKAIERSPATRYFVEGNNGRRLGAGSYHTGVYIGGTNNGVFYNVAVTNPERDEFSSGDSTANATPGVSNVGNKTNNGFAYWGNLGYADKFAGGSYKLGLQAGYLPDQGGKTVGTGHDLKVYGAFVDVTSGVFNFAGEYFTSENPQGASATRDSKGWAYWAQPSVMLTPQLEALVRYTYVDSDHRGVDLGDGIRSAPGGGTMDKMSEWFVGGNYYFKADNVKLQLGYIHGESKDTIAGGAAKATTDGARSQMQINF